MVNRAEVIKSPRHVLDNTLFTLGNDNDVAITLVSAANSADAEVTNLIEGTSDHQGTAANSLVISNVTNDGDIQMLVSDGGNSKEFLLADGDTAILYLGHGMAATTIKNVNQIAFLASQSASADANTLDDYEEGTWTPAIGDSDYDGSGEGQAYSVQVGHYTKIGNLVNVSGHVAISDLGTMTVGDTAAIVGLPFTSHNVTNAHASATVGFGVSLALPNASEAMAGTIPPNAAYISLRNWDGVTGTSVLLISELSVGAQFGFSATYRV
jgi:hypothetical protein